jgi:hypothetical protein
VSELLAGGRDDVFAIVDQSFVKTAATMPAEAVHLGLRMAIERLLDIDVWLQTYQPTLKLT